MFINIIFVSWFARNSQFMSSFSSSSRKNFSSIRRSHSVHNPCLFLLFFRWLKRSFAHCFVSLKSYLYVSRFEYLLSKTECKYTKTFFLSSSFVKIFSIHFTIFAFIKQSHYVSQEY
jgi:hypothetical protein